MSADESAGLVPTRSSLSKQGSLPEFQEVVFSRYKPKNLEKQNEMKRNSYVSKLPSSKKKDERSTFMKKARYDIIKFGMTGFDAQKREETKQALAISLGAIPKKKKAINYKELKEQKKTQKELEKERQTADSVMTRAPASNKVGRKQLLKNEYNRKSGILDIYGKVNKKDVKNKAPKSR